jgi:hypothetical protein
MSRKHHEHEEVWAILRIDLFQFRESADGPATMSDLFTVEHFIRVKEIVWDRELAEREAARLNALNAGNDCHYWVSRSRLFPPGKSFASP